VTDVIAAWTGCHADCLRRALRMTSEDFAGHLGVAVRTVAYWRGRPDMVPQPAMQDTLDAALARAPERARALFWQLQSGCDGPAGSAPLAGGLLGSEDAASLSEWVTASSVGDEAVAGLDRAAGRLAEAHGRAAPVLVLAEARQVQASVQALLRGGRLRHRQARELLRIDGALLAQVGLLLSDLGDDAAGEEYASAALLYLREAGAAEPPAWYVLAKIARWRHQYARAADLARRGLERAGPGPMAVQLACYEANASALAGDAGRARDAMARAEAAAGALPPGDMTLSPWSFPAERMAMFRLSVALGTGDPGGALAAAEGWREGPAPGRPRNQAALAQLRIGAAIAHLAAGEVDGAAERVAPVLELAPEFRIATVTGWLDDLDARLAHSRHATSPLAADLRHQIRHFTTTSAPTEGE